MDKRVKILVSVLDLLYSLFIIYVLYLTSLYAINQVTLTRLIKYFIIYTVLTLVFGWRTGTVFSSMLSIFGVYYMTKLLNYVAGYYSVIGSVIFFSLIVIYFSVKYRNEILNGKSLVVRGVLLILYAVIVEGLLYRSPIGLSLFIGIGVFMIFLRLFMEIDQL